MSKIDKSTAHLLANFVVVDEYNQFHALYFFKLGIVDKMYLQFVALVLELVYILLKKSTLLSSTRVFSQRSSYSVRTFDFPYECTHHGTHENMIFPISPGKHAPGPPQYECLHVTPYTFVFNPFTPKLKKYILPTF